jgi:hypothetical protein
MSLTWHVLEVCIGNSSGTQIVVLLVRVPRYKEINSLSALCAFYTFFFLRCFPTWRNCLTRNGGRGATVRFLMPPSVRRPQVGPPCVTRPVTPPLSCLKGRSCCGVSCPFSAAMASLTPCRLGSSSLVVRWGSIYVGRLARLLVW